MMNCAKNDLNSYDFCQNYTKNYNNLYDFFQNDQTTM